MRPDTYWIQRTVSASRRRLFRRERGTQRIILSACRCCSCQTQFETWRPNVSFGSRPSA
jgi:hypothetical protein